MHLRIERERYLCEVQHIEMDIESRIEHIQQRTMLNF